MTKLEQEPVAWCVINDGEVIEEPTLYRDKAEEILAGQIEDSGSEIAPLYTTPPQRKPLTDEQIKAALWEAYKADLEAQGIDTQGMDFNQWYSPSHLFYAKAAIEAAHGIKE